MNVGLLVVILVNLSTTLCNKTDNGTPIQPKACDAPTQGMYLGFQVMTVLVTVVGALGNILSLLVICTSPDLRRQSSYSFLVSLATADLGMSLIVLPIRTDMYRHNRSFCSPLSWCVAYTFFDFLFPITSALHMLLIAVDRGVAIMRPYLYERAFDRRRVMVCIASVWMWCIAWAGLGLVRWGTGEFEISIIKAADGSVHCFNYNKYFVIIMLILFIILPMLMAFFIYAAIMRIVFRQTQAMSQQNGDASNTKVIRLVVTLFLAFAICYFPSTLFLLLYYLSPNSLAAFGKNHPTAYSVISKLCLDVLLYLNSCINPFIYFVAGTHFRTALSKIAKKLMMNRPLSHQGNMKVTNITGADNYAYNVNSTIH